MGYLQAERSVSRTRTIRAIVSTLPLYDLEHGLAKSTQFLTAALGEQEMYTKRSSPLALRIAIIDLISTAELKILK